MNQRAMDPATRNLGRADFSITVVWFAMTAAIIELLARGVQHYVLGDVMRVSRDILWMAPIGQLMWFVPAAAMLAIVAAVRRKPVSAPLAAGAFGFLAVLGVLVIPDGMHPVGALLLAGGAAVQVARVVRSRPGRFARLVRRTLPIQMVALALVAGGVMGRRVLRERRAVAALPPAATSAPNVVLLIWDTVRAPSLSLYGNTRRTTPNLDSLAKSGVVFERAIAPAPWTLPSHASMFTGYMSHQLNVGWIRPLDGSKRTLAEAFRDAGYVTGGFAANVLYADWEHGLARGFLHYEDYTVGPGQIFLSTALGFRIAKGRHGWERAPIPYVAGYRQFVGRRLGESVDREFLEWVDQRDDRPFFAFLNYFDAHLPYEPPPPFDRMFTPERPEVGTVERLRRVIDGKGLWASLDADGLAAELAAYEASIAYLDHRLGKLVEELKRRNLLDNTLIILTSDHGEEFLEHGDHEHGSNVYLTQLHVPLVVLYPGRIPTGVRVADPVSLRHVAATIAELSDLPEADAFPGRSLEAWWTSPRPSERPVERELAVSDLKVRIGPGPRLFSLMLDRRHYIKNIDGSIELYDVVSDPGERVNLAAGAASADIARPWERALEAALACAAPACCCQAPEWLATDGPGVSREGDRFFAPERGQFRTERESAGSR